MVQTLIRIERPIDLVLSQSEQGLNLSDWKLLYDINVMFKCLSDALEILESDSTLEGKCFCSISMGVPVIYQLLQNLQEEEKNI